MSGNVIASGPGPLASRPCAPSRPPVHVVELGDRLRVWIDAQHAAEVEGRLVPAPIQIEPPWVGVDLNDDVMLSIASPAPNVPPLPCSRPCKPDLPIAFGFGHQRAESGTGLQSP